MPRSLLLTSALFLAACPGNPDLPEGPDACRSVTLARVVEVIDGDTADVEFLEGDNLGEVDRVRFNGIDTPEVDHDDPLGSEFCGLRAWNEAISLLEGEEVWLTFDTSCTGTFGRTLVYGFRTSDELWFNEHMVEQGYARVSGFDFAFVDSFTSKEEEAMLAGRGLWGDCTE
ncbi:MAG: thermonuclease family protein [Deltaproteobacteria bacterium]|nr:thermonuclease family protein [Deltaproteobacteria bacterium]